SSKAAEGNLRASIFSMRALYQTYLLAGLIVFHISLSFGTSEQIQRGICNNALRELGFASLSSWPPFRTCRF
ncbi:MAG: hypothetical protein N0E45_09495, partial [Candidatus Thiodiazotropha endolucinida]|nr:hypothetical protein [Candidatus Thiodiazotropha taylori]MCW4299881.1 hypothetical protein [Candidatus Thiodiazotropha endolucinida]